jgi:tyrosyl-tRNA synthetase
MKCIRMLTFLPLEQIDEMAKWEGSDLNRAKEILAFELTSMVHGEEEARKAEASAKALFSGTGSSENMPTTELTADDLLDGRIDILSLLVKAGLCTTKSDARRNVQQGGVTVEDQKVTDIAALYDADTLRKGLMVRRGKKNFNKVILK